MEFCEKIDETTRSQKTSRRTRPTASFLTTGGVSFNYLKMHAVVAAFHIYAQCGEDAAKTRGWQP